MKRAVLLAALLWLACLLPLAPAHAFSAGDATALGNVTVSSLNKRYLDGRKDCGKSSRPAFLCSGVLLRATEDSNAFFAWNPSPRSQRVGGVSFSYLRADSKFTKLVFNYKNGFILYPIFDSPKDKMDIEVLCFFPVDGYTGNRTTLQGCGPSDAYPNASGPCQKQKITTVAQWTQHFTSVAAGSSRNKHQCAFDTTDKNDKSADPFYQGLLSMNAVPDASFIQQNEVMLKTWAQNIPAKLPIQAFFYLDNDVTGAKNDQKKFYDQTKIFVPVVKITMPKTSRDDVGFEFRPEDQAVTF